MAAHALRRVDAGPPERYAPASPRRFAFVLIDAFSMMSISAAIEPLRAANRLLGSDFYRWSLLSPDGKPVRASNGIELSVDGSIDGAVEYDIVFVCAGLHASPRPQRRFTLALRRALARGALIGAISAGAFVLARAGLLDGYRCTIHWEYRPAFTEAFPDIEATNAIFEIDRDRYTCSGGVASMDLVLTLIALDHGMQLRNAVANQFHLERARSPDDSQRTGAIGHFENAPSPLRRAIGFMLSETENPLSIPEIAKRIGLTSRQLERLFAKNIGESPVRYYLGIRLERARDLLIHTNLPVLEVAVASGFESCSHFSQCYRTRYAQTPTQARRGSQAAKGPT